MSQQTATRISHVATVIVPVTDQVRALDFYTRLLGLELRTDVPFGDGNRWVEVAPAGAQTTVALGVPPAGSPIGVITGISFVTDDIDTLHAELRAGGVDVDESVARWGDPVPPMFWLRDPDGNSLMVVEQTGA